MYANELNGFNGARRIFEEGTNISEEIEGQRAITPPPIFQIAVVTEVLTNPKSLSSMEMQELETESATPELCRRAPPNSIVARVITRNQDRFDRSSRIFFPVDIYGAEPVKPGEQVFVFFVDPIVNDQIGYWWKRVPQPIDTDDLNFTHADRRFEYNKGMSTSERFEGNSPEKPGFINGGGQDAEQQTLAGENDFKTIQKNAKANDLIVREPVARFKKRPGDKVVQDSNGARIVLGLDRIGPAIQKPRAKSSTIDLVVGYGREGTPTAPKTVLNDRNELEVDKAPEKQNAKDNPIEGDPDFKFDKSRLYISEDTDVDTNFAFTINGVPFSVGRAAAHAVRSDRIRFDARQDFKLRAGDTALVLDRQGNVKIVAPGQATVNLGSANPSLGVARLNDQITIDQTTDPTFVGIMRSLVVWATSLSTALQAIPLTAGIPAFATIAASQGITPAPPPSVTGKITQASTKVKSE
jgi:hypothetical protein